MVVWPATEGNEVKEGQEQQQRTHSRSKSLRTPESLDLCRRLCWRAYLKKCTSDESPDMLFWPPDASLLLCNMRMAACTWKRRFMLARGM